MDLEPGVKPDSSATPLYVDLDGTLIKSDLLYESVFSLLKVNFFYLFLLPFWLFEGKARLKHKIAEKTDVAPHLLPYNQPFLSFLINENKKGRKLILATASNKKYAEKIAAHLGIFSSIISSDENTNLSGSKKLALIKKQENGHFSYAGNDNIDLKIFKEANSAILVNPVSGLEKKTAKLTHIEQTFIDKSNPIKSTIKAIRVHQWVKNLLIFVPFLTAQLWGTGAIWLVLAGFLSFSLTASSVYLLNDMLDLESDRNHPRKCNRPFAAGNLSILTGVIMLLALVIISFLIAWYVSIYFFAVLFVYLIMTLSYSTILKAYVLIDVVLLASLYTIRVIAGAAIVGVEPSFWLLAFSMFIFLSLALVKRCSELYSLRSRGKSCSDGRDYNTTDLESLQAMGTASGYTAVLVIAFFINSKDVIEHYSNPQVLWLICPAFLYWISRVWLKTARGEMDDDPIVFSIKDRGSRYIALLVAIIVLGAI